MRPLFIRCTVILCLISTIVLIGSGLPIGAAGSRITNAGRATGAAAQSQKLSRSTGVRVNSASPASTECFIGSLTSDDFRFHRPNTTTTGSGVPAPCSLSPTGTNVVFDIYEFSIRNCATFPTPVTITLCGPEDCTTEPPGFDSVIYIYRVGGLTGTNFSAHPFNRNNPCNNLVAANDDLSGEAVGPGGSSGGLTACSTNGTLSGLKRSLGSGNFVIVVAGAANSTMGNYNLLVDVPDVSCALAPEPTVVMPTLFDFDYDGKADLSVFTPEIGQWTIMNSFAGGTDVRFLGGPNDVITPADYDGDGKTDIAVWRHEVGFWFIRNSSTMADRIVGWGVDGDIPVPADYDGDAIADVAVWRPSTGGWHIINSSGIPNTVVGWGMSGDVPAPGDYDGDHKTDQAVFRPSTGEWFILQSSSSTANTVVFAASGDKIVPGDYDGDGKSDIAVWRPASGTWYILNSSNGSTTTVGWGAATDIPVPADYDGDGKTDVAVWRPSTGTWFIINSSSGLPVTRVLGMSGDIPVPSAYVR